MFIYNISDILTYGAVALVLVMIIVAAIYSAIKQAFCKHDWSFIDPPYGNKYWKCFKCDKEHDSLTKPTK